LPHFFTPSFPPSLPVGLLSDLVRSQSGPRSRFPIPILPGSQPSPCNSLLPFPPPHFPLRRHLSSNGDVSVVPPVPFFGCPPFRLIRVTSRDCPPIAIPLLQGWTGEAPVPMAGSTFLDTRCSPRHHDPPPPYGEQTQPRRQLHRLSSPSPPILRTSFCFCPPISPASFSCP